jgi:sugar phosphate isomerase/epimerase
VAANTTAEILAAWSPRLRHVHLHDNLGGRDDLHLPLGAGTLDDAAAVQALKRVGYDHTITLEIHSEDKSLVRQSADRLRRLWSGI